MRILRWLLLTPFITLIAANHPISDTLLTVPSSEYDESASSMQGSIHKRNELVLNKGLNRRRLRTGAYLDAVRQPSYYGVHWAELTGPLVLQNGTSVTARAHVFYKALRVNATNLAIRAIVHFFDVDIDPFTPADNADDPLSVPKPLHRQPDYLQHLQQCITLHLQPAAFGKAFQRGDGLPDIRLTPQPFGTIDEGLLKPANIDSCLPLYTIENRYNTTLPLVLNATLPAHALLEKFGVTDFYLTLDGWAHTALVSYNSLWQNSGSWHPSKFHKNETKDGQQNSHTTASARSTGELRLRMLQEETGNAFVVESGVAELSLSFVVVMQPLFHGDFNTSAGLLEINMAFHSTLGFNKTVLYERGSFLSSIMGHGGLHRYMRIGYLEIMLWNHELGAPAISANYIQQRTYENFGLTYDRGIVHSHAALAYWGRNAYLYFADMDDFVKLKPQQTIQQVVAPDGVPSACGDYYVNAAWYSLLRYNYWCSENAPDVQPHPYGTLQDTLGRRSLLNVFPQTIQHGSNDNISNTQGHPEKLGDTALRENGLREDAASRNNSSQHEQKQDSATYHIALMSSQQEESHRSNDVVQAGNVAVGDSTVEWAPAKGALRHLFCRNRDPYTARPRFIVHADAAAVVDAPFVAVWEHLLQDSRWVPEECSGVAHLFNMRGATWNPAHELETGDDAFWWPLERVLQQR